MKRTKHIHVWLKDGIIYAVMINHSEKPGKVIRMDEDKNEIKMDQILTFPVKDQIPLLRSSIPVFVDKKDSEIYYKVIAEQITNHFKIQDGKLTVK